MSDSPENRNYYSKAGVNVKTGQDFVDLIKPLAKTTAIAGVKGTLGGFAALFDTKAAGFEDPVLVAATDGVGTKLLLALSANKHQTIGIDLVAMCVNDLLAQRARPLFFLDYFATGQLDTEVASKVVEGIVAGCQMAGCALIGGETAEMPGLYSTGHYDLAGFAVGAIERRELQIKNDIQPGDMILGITSSGPHSNGFSLIRKLLSDNSINLQSKTPFDPTKTFAEALLTPTKIYISSVLSLLNNAKCKIKGIAHITGGGLYENIPRILPPGLSASLDATAWSLPPIFQWIREIGEINCEEMAGIFNCGIGLVIVVGHDEIDTANTILSEHGEHVYNIGKINSSTTDTPLVVIDNMHSSWET